ncbi:MAG: hypothetical protein ACFB9N_00555 [Geitlerinemataceae cyanobacterium]
MDYLYQLKNATSIVNAIEYVRDSELPVRLVTAIHQIDGWVLRIQMRLLPSIPQHRELRLAMEEMAIPLPSSPRLQVALWNLDMGQSAVSVMQRHQVAIVSHGKPDTRDIELFCAEFTKGLGYKPETLA